MPYMPILIKQSYIHVHLKCEILKFKVKRNCVFRMTDGAAVAELLPTCVLCCVLLLACRYVARKIQAAGRGEAQPEKANTASCSQAKGRFGSSG